MFLRYFRLDQSLILDPLTNSSVSDNEKDYPVKYYNDGEFYSHEYLLFTFLHDMNILNI
jgi:hypothetical protein